MCMKYFTFPKRLLQSPVIMTIFINLFGSFPVGEKYTNSLCPMRTAFAMTNCQV